jgi:hypothetical protein
MVILNPFKKHDVSEFEGVLVPLSEAEHLNASIVPHAQTNIASTPGNEADEKKLEKDANKQNDDLERNSSAPSVRGGTARSGHTIGLTIQDLRAEVEMDVAANDTHSAYDSKSRGSIFTPRILQA